MPEFTLKGFRESGNSYKVALMLELCQADWICERVAFFTGQTRSDEFRDQNVMGEVPVLVHHKPDEDLVLSQSGSILYHLAEHFGQFNPQNDAEEREVLRWILWDNHKLTSYTATHRFQRLMLNQNDEVAQFFAARAKSAYKVLNKHLEERNWVAADRPTIADISICGYLFWPEQIFVDWADYPAVSNWLDRVKSLEHWAKSDDLMPSGREPSVHTA